MLSPHRVVRIFFFFCLSRDYRLSSFCNMISLLVSQLYFDVILFDGFLQESFPSSFCIIVLENCMNNALNINRIVGLCCKYGLCYFSTLIPCLDFPHCLSE